MHKNLKTKEKDSLVIKPEQSKTLKFNDNFLLNANLPFSELEKNKISIVNKDSLNIEFETKLDLIKNQYSIIFEKAEEISYIVIFCSAARVLNLTRNSDWISSGSMICALSSAHSC